MLISSLYDEVNLSKEDLLARTHLSKTLLQRFEEMGIVQNLNDTNQLSLFD